MFDNALIAQGYKGVWIIICHGSILISFITGKFKHWIIRHWVNDIIVNKKFDNINKEDYFD